MRDVSKWRSGQQICVFRVFLDIAGDEGAEWFHFQLLCAGEIKQAVRQCRTDAASFERLRHLGVSDSPVRQYSENAMFPSTSISKRLRSVLSHTFGMNLT
jgi:hypothetical protein